MTRLRSSVVACVALLAARSLAGAESFSTSIMKPTAVPETGVISGPFTGTQSRWYFTLDVKPGELLTQISFGGREGARKELELELLDSSARVKDRYWVHGSEASAQATRAFAIDGTGKQVLRVAATGPETSKFCIELGGSAFPTTGGQGCPALGDDSMKARAPAASSGASAAKIEVLESECEQRLRVGADVFFDFDSAAIRPDATPTLAEIQRRVAATSRPVTVEGHTDSKGTDDYNERLSRERAASVEVFLEQSGIANDRLSVVGYGEKRPVAPNERTDGSDDPNGRQKNRRVEIVIDTCA